MKLGLAIISDKRLVYQLCILEY